MNYRIDSTQSAVVVKISSADFDQLMRFLDAVTKFILVERPSRPILDDIAWYCPPTDTGSVT